MKRRVKLLFPQHLVKEPVLFTMAKRYDVIPNIRRARVTDEIGEMILELDGDEANLEQGIAALRAQGIEVEYIEGEIFDL
ncbi:MAG: ferredoxin [Nitrospiraceae bacterium]|jgi:ABC-type methionine transport system ATPase subunit|nr:ferredoxin [Nitrospiraceae bacterium]